MIRCMRMILLAPIVSLALLCNVAIAQQPAEVVVLATGGTIAGQGKSDVSANYDPAKLSGEALLSALPQLSNLANVRAEQIANIASQNMSYGVWYKLAKRVQELLSQDAVSGVVITHGTDTLEETAYFLSLVVDSEKPVVLTAAMRPANGLSADGPMNLYNAVAVASSPASRGRGVVVVINDTIHGARSVTKSNTTELHTFDSGVAGAVGTAQVGRVRYYRSNIETPVAKTFPLKDKGVLPRVDILFGHVASSSDLIDAAVVSGAKGLVIAGVGNGNMNRASLAAVERAVKQGVVVVRSSRVGSGYVDRNMEINDDALGTLAAGNLSPAKSRILLQLALQNSNDIAQIQDMFTRY